MRAGGVWGPGPTPSLGPGPAAATHGCTGRTGLVGSLKYRLFLPATIKPSPRTAINTEDRMSSIRFSDVGRVVWVGSVLLGHGRRPRRQRGRQNQIDERQRSAA